MKKRIYNHKLLILIRILTWFPLPGQAEDTAEVTISQQVGQAVVSPVHFWIKTQQFFRANESLLQRVIWVFFWNKLKTACCVLPFDAMTIGFLKIVFYRKWTKQLMWILQSSISPWSQPRQSHQTQPCEKYYLLLSCMRQPVEGGE